MTHYTGSQAGNVQVDFMTYLNQLHADLYLEFEEPGAYLRTDSQFTNQLLPSHPNVNPPTSPYFIVIPFPQHTFPVHLLSHIFSFLFPSQSDDASTLVSCILTCKKWALPAQIRLYHSILVQDEQSLFSLWDHLSSTPHLSRRVREVRVKDRARSEHEKNKHTLGAAHTRNRMPSIPGWFLRAPDTLAPILPNTEVLTLEHIDWRAFWLRTGNDVPSMKWLSKWALFPPLHELVLTSCSFTSFREFELVMASFPALSKLSLDAISWGEHHIAVVEAARPGTKRQSAALRELHIGYSCDIHTITKWMLGSSSAKTIKRLEYDAGHEASPVFFFPFLHDLCETMEYLRVGSAWVRNSLGEMLNSHINFHAWPRLRTLHCTLLSLQPGRLDWVPISLARAFPGLPRPHNMCPTKACSPMEACSECRTRVCSITTVAFDVWLSDAAQLENPVWDQIILVLHRLVAGGRGIRRIVFIQRGGELTRTEAEDVVKRRMGSLHALVEVRTEGLADVDDSELEVVHPQLENS